jgi:hypothetical protein
MDPGSRYLPAARKLLARVLLALVSTLVSLLVGLKAYDIVLWRTALRGPDGATLRREHKEGALPFQQMQWYPYTGAHIQSNQYYFGPVPLENTDFYSEFEYKSGDHGFFVGFDLEQPPRKATAEFRIILIGGSAAQGWGAHRIEDMIYRQVERKLNALFQGSGITVRVINLAMAGSISYQNYIALNIWGHALEPDLILSYSGGNDLLVPQQLRSDAPMAWDMVAAYVASMHFNQGSPVVRDMERWFPGLMRFTRLGPTLRFLTMTQTGYSVRAKYVKERNMGEADIVRGTAIPQYIKSFQSIKRDFDGIPIMIAFQPIDFRMLPDTQQVDPEYREMIRQTIEQCRGYKNNKWYFVNLHAYWRENDLYKMAKLGNGLHLTSSLHETVAGVLAKQLVPVIKETMRQRRVRNSRGPVFPSDHIP